MKQECESFAAELEGMRQAWAREEKHWAEELEQTYLAEKRRLQVREHTYVFSGLVFDDFLFKNILINILSSSRPAWLRSDARSALGS